MRTLLILTCTASLLFGALGCNDDEAPPAGSIQGTVTLETGEPAQGASVEFQNIGRLTSTSEEGTFEFQGLRPDTYTLVVRLDTYVTARAEVEVVDGETATPSITLDQVNEAPTIDDIALNPESPSPAQTIAVTVTASDPNPDMLTYAYEATSGFSVDSSDGNTASIIAPDTFGARGSLSVVVTDEDGATARERISLSTVTNSPPDINGINATPQTVQPGGTATILATASDAETDALAYQWTAPSGWSIDDPNAAEIEVTAPNMYGATGIFQLTVTDSAGFSVDASFGLSTAMNNGPIISSITASSQTVGRGGELQLDVSATDPNGDSLSYQWSAPSGWTFNDTSVEDPTLTAPDAPGQTANVQVTVSDGNGGSVNGSVVVSTRPNTSPVITEVVATNSDLNAGGTTQVTANATDPEGDPLSYTWTVGNSSWSTTGSGATISLQAPQSADSSTMLTVEVSDDVGGSSTSTIVVSTVPNGAPVVANIYPNSNPVPRDATTQMNVQASDPNGDALSYNWSVDNSAWSVSGSGATVTLDAPSTPDSSVLVTATVTDGQGGSTTATAQVSTASNKAPTITSIPSIPSTVSAARGPAVNYQVQASDPDDANLTWNVSSVPQTSVTVDSSGLVQWLPTHDDANTTVTFTVTANDGNDTVSQTFSVQVGDVSFQTAGSFSVADNTGVGVADFDGDGLTDVAGMRNFDEDLSYVLSGDNYGTQYIYDWSGTVDFDNCDWDTAANLDGDNTIDIISACDDDGAGSANLTLVTWINQLPNNGGISDGVILNTGVTSSPTDLATLDLNGDNAAEIVVSDFSDTIHVFDNNGAGQLSVSQSMDPVDPVNYSSGYQIERVRPADVDNDPQMELVVLESYTNTGGSSITQVAVYSFNASGTLSATRDSTVTLFDNPDKMQVGDVDGDGSPDVVVKTDGVAAADVAVETYLNDGAGNFTFGDSVSSPTLCNNSSNRGIAIGDIDQDGNADIVVGDDCDSSVHIAFGQGSGTLGQLFQTSQGTFGFDETENVYIGHTNSDSYPDIIAWDWGRFSVFY
jgi:hypothetical protein